MLLVDVVGGPDLFDPFVPLVSLVEEGFVTPKMPVGMVVGTAVSVAEGFSAVDDFKLNEAGVWDLKEKPPEGLLAPKANPANGLGLTTSSCHDKQM